MYLSSEERIQRSSQVAVLFLVLLNIFDFTVTTEALKMGYVELNPVMAALFHIHPGAPLIMKMLVLSGLWAVTVFTSWRWLMRVLWFLVGTYLALALYELTMFA